MLETSDKLKEPSNVTDEQPLSYFDNTYLPGETKEQFELGKQVKQIASSGNSYKVGSLTISWTGSLAITGVGFQPKMLTIIASNGSATPRLVQSTGYSDWTTTACQYIYEDTTSPNFVTSMTSSWIVYLERNATNTRASLTSFNADGFTINVVAFGVTGSTLNYIAQS